MHRPFSPPLPSQTRERLARLDLPANWRPVRALAGFAKAVDVLDAASAPILPAARRPVLSALLCLAPADALAAEVFLAAVVPALRAVAAELSRWDHVECDEVDSLLVLGACEALNALGGTANMWPDRAVISRARDAARPRLLAEGRRSSRETLRDELAGEAAGEPEQELGALLAADILRSAVAKGSLSLSSAGLLWATHVEGASTAELARLGSRSPRSVAMKCLRAGRALERRWREVLTIAMLSAGSERYYVRSAFDAIDEYYVKGEERG